MRTALRFPSSLVVPVWLLLAAAAWASKLRPPHEIDSPQQSPEAADAIPLAATNSDTLWIADWTFDAAGGRCTDAGWTRYDNYVRNDGSNYWSVSAAYAGTGRITGNAAVLRKHDLGWVRDGYGNDWDYSIVLKYRGPSTLSFDFLSDSEPGYDFVRVEADSAGASESRVDYRTNPLATAVDYRTLLVEVDSLQSQRIVRDLALPDFGAPTVVHEAYIRFSSDGGFSDEDGDYASAFNAGLVVDNVAVTGGLAYTEDFECGEPGCLDTNMQLVNSAPSTPFGLWARLWPQPTDKDVCADNRTCAWIFTDPSSPASSAEMAFGPQGTVVRNWLDNVIVSPWVSLSGLPPYGSTVLSFRRFPGNVFSTGKIVQGWRVRSRLCIDNTDTTTPGDSIEVATPWAHASSWNTLSAFKWGSLAFDMGAYIPAGARAIQVSFRTSDWQLVAGSSPPEPPNVGPGPYLDRVRIGRRTFTGPVFRVDAPSTTTAADGFPSIRNAIAPGENFSPTIDRFGTVDFASPSVSIVNATIGRPPLPNTMDSIAVHVSDVRMTGGIWVGIYAAIVSGPHAGKAPPPWNVGESGFFVVDADSVRFQSGELFADNWYVDLDDEYFRGGDEIVYFWAATDAGGGFTSSPRGLTSVPSSVAQAEEATGGLFEFNALPTIDWDPAYLARVAAHPSGKVAPTPEEVANSRQRTSILYVWQRPWARRSGSVNRTAFMHALDQLGYRGLYDRYFIPTYWSIYLAHLAGRASPVQATGYALIIQDSQRNTWNVLPPPDHRERPEPQVQWYRDWLAQAATSAAGRATLWLLGDEFVASEGNNPLVAEDMGVTVAHSTQTLIPYPEISGGTSFTWANGDSTDFTGDRLLLKNSVCKPHGNNGLVATGTAVVTHRFTRDGSAGDGAMVMNANAAAAWNTILGSFSWEDLLDPLGSSPGDGEAAWLEKILAGVLPDSIRALAQPTDAPDRTAGLPRVTVLHQNVPNPFNPVTTIRFDLAQSNRVTMHVYDVAGRRVRTLVDASMQAGWNHAVTWNGQDENGRRVASGIYFYRLSTGEYSRTMKLLLLR